jgi:hypothetical protein
MLDRPPLARPEKRGSQDSTKPFQAAAGRLDPPPTPRVSGIFLIRAQVPVVALEILTGAGHPPLLDNNIRETP